MAIIKTLKDKLGNIIYPQTLVKSVYDEDGKTLDTLMAGKVSNTRKVNGKTLTTDITLTASDIGAVSAVTSATEGNIPTLTADGQLQDSGKKVDELGGAFVVTLTTSYTEDGDAQNSADKTYAEIKAAYEAGKEIKLKIDDVTGSIYFGFDGIDGDNGPMWFSGAVHSNMDNVLKLGDYMGLALSSNDQWKMFYKELLPEVAPSNDGYFLQAVGRSSGAGYWVAVDPPFLKTVDSTTENHMPAFDANGQLVDSGKALDDLQDFVVTFTYEGVNTLVADKTWSELVAAIEAGKNCRGICSYRRYHLNRYDPTHMTADFIASSLVMELIYNLRWAGNADGTTRELYEAYTKTLPSTSTTDAGKIAKVDQYGGWELGSLTASDVGALPDTTAIPTILSGTTDPSATLGSDGDIYIKYTE